MNRPQHSSAGWRVLLALAGAGLVVAAALALRPGSRGAELDITHEFRLGDNRTAPHLEGMREPEPGDTPSPDARSRGGVRVRVTSVEDSPILDALIESQTLGTVSWRSVRTDRGGVALLERPRGNGPLRLRVSHPGFAPTSWSGTLPEGLDLVLKRGCTVALRIIGPQSGLRFPLRVVYRAGGRSQSIEASDANVALERVPGRSLQIVRVGPYHPRTPLIFTLPEEGLVSLRVVVPAASALVLIDPGLPTDARVRVFRLAAPSGRAIREVASGGADASRLEVRILGAGPHAYYAQSSSGWAYGEFHLSGTHDERVERDLAWSPTCSLEVRTSSEHELVDVSGSVAELELPTGIVRGGVLSMIQLFEESVSQDDPLELYAKDFHRATPAVFDLPAPIRTDTGAFLYEQVPADLKVSIRGRLRGIGWIRKSIQLPGPGRKGLLKLAPSGIGVDVVLKNLAQSRSAGEAYHFQLYRLRDHGRKGSVARIAGCAPRIRVSGLEQGENYVATVRALTGSAEVSFEARPELRVSLTLGGDSRETVLRVADDSGALPGVRVAIGAVDRSNLETRTDEQGLVRYLCCAQLRPHVQVTDPRYQYVAATLTAGQRAELLVTPARTVRVEHKGPQRHLRISLSTTDWAETRRRVMPTQTACEIRQVPRGPVELEIEVLDGPAAGTKLAAHLPSPPDDRQTTTVTVSEDAVTVR